VIETDVSIHVEHISKWYPTTSDPVHAVQDVSLDFKPGEFVSILGPSGCGKSTLLMMLAGLIPATSGTVTIGSTEVTKPYTDLGIVFQNPVLLDWLDVMSNVMLQADIRNLDLKESEVRARYLLDMVDLDGFAERQPYELSGGMRQRVAICRALLHRPPIILMDEPFGALDAITRDQLNLDLLDIWQQESALTVFVTHSIAEAVFLSDRVLVMSPRPGTIVETFDIDLPRPRHLAIRETPEFARYSSAIRTVFERLGVLKEDNVPTDIMSQQPSETSL